MVNELDKDENGNLIDDIKNPAIWEKANPIAASYAEGRDYLQKKLDEALEAPEKMRNFLTKHLDVWVNQKENGYLSMEKWKKCGGKLPDLAGAECWIGLDLSSKLDLTSVGFEFKVGETFVVQSHSFVPAEKLEEKQKRDKVPFALWREQGWITATPGPVIDYKTVYNYIVDQVKDRGLVVREICLDPWGGLALANDLIAAGFVVVNIIQGIKTLSEPTKHFREMVYAGRVVHDENPVLSWAISNAIADEVDRNQNILLNKKKSRERIDPIAAIINAHVRASIGSIVSTVKEPRVFFA
jgi:phage terminase large subunit-like protein